MPYRVQINSSAQKEIKNLEHEVQRRIKSKILSLADAPRSHGAIKLQSNDDLYRIRVGNFRIVYQINDSSPVVLVVRVRDRKDVYD